MSKFLKLWYFIINLINKLTPRNDRLHVHFHNGMQNYWHFGFTVTTRSKLFRFSISPNQFGQYKVSIK